jgi:formylglycine-generating enzyme required for sulfatase activity
MTSQELKDWMNAGATSLKLPVADQEIELLRIPAGSFSMGSPRTEIGHQDTEYPVRKIRISKPFYLGRYEIMQGQYTLVMGSNPGRFLGDALPVDQIRHSDARDFCGKLSALAGIEVTLPTEAQWECAARAGTTTRFYTGDREADLDKAGWWRRNSNETVHPVGQKEPNAFGLYDMLGNVWEHCLDILPSYDTISDIDPVGRINYDEGTMHGGSWMNSAEYCRAACGLRTNDMFGGAGIRIVINPE